MSWNFWRGTLATWVLAAVPGFCDVKTSTTYTADGQTAEASIYANGTRSKWDRHCEPGSH